MEKTRLTECRENNIPWKKWGPYLSERQWGTVREDYSPGGDAWNIKTGVKIKTASVVSFKLNAYLQSMIGTAGNDYWYTWYGVVAVADYASIFQFGWGASVCIDLPGK